jgi:hypothetical protein
MPDPATDKCLRCSSIILDGELAVRNHGDWYHLRCWRILTSFERVRESSARSRHARQRIEQSVERIERTYRPSGGPPVVLCVACHLGIATAAELEMTSSGPRHLGCKPEQDAEAR